MRVAKSSSFRYADHATFLKTISFEDWNANRKTNEAATKQIQTNFVATGFIVSRNNHRKSKCWESKQHRVGLAHQSMLALLLFPRIDRRQSKVGFAFSKTVLFRVFGLVIMSYARARRTSRGKVTKIIPKLIPTFHWRNFIQLFSAKRKFNLVFCSVYFRFPLFVFIHSVAFLAPFFLRRLGFRSRLNAAGFHGLLKSPP